MIQGLETVCYGATVGPTLSDMYNILFFFPNIKTKVIMLLFKFFIKKILAQINSLTQHLFFFSLIQHLMLKI